MKKTKAKPVSLHNFKEDRKCPHCTTSYWNDGNFIDIGNDVDGNWYIFKSTCPSCNKLILSLLNGEKARGDLFYVKDQLYCFKPQYSSGHTLPPKEVPKDIANDYREACLTLDLSPKASAALSRRCLQHILNDKSGIKAKDLAPHIEQLIAQGNLPSHISEALDYVRNVGNFAAHPMKSKTSGEILPVDPDEAEWNLSVIKLLFDFYYVQPEIANKNKRALNKKLSKAGKPLLK